MGAGSTALLASQPSTEELPGDDRSRKDAQR